MWINLSSQPQWNVYCHDTRNDISYIHISFHTFYCWNFIVYTAKHSILCQLCDDKVEFKTWFMKLLTKVYNSRVSTLPNIHFPAICFRKTYAKIGNIFEWSSQKSCIHRYHSWMWWDAYEHSYLTEQSFLTQTQLKNTMQKTCPPWTKQCHLVHRTRVSYRHARHTWHDTRDTTQTPKLVTRCHRVWISLINLCW